MERVIGIEFSFLDFQGVKFLDHFLKYKTQPTFLLSLWLHSRSIQRGQGFKDWQTPSSLSKNINYKNKTTELYKETQQKKNYKHVWIFEEVKGDNNKNDGGDDDDKLENIPKN